MYDVLCDLPGNCYVYIDVMVICIVLFFMYIIDANDQC